MHWAKTASGARFKLATSGVPSVALADLPISLEEIEVTGPDGYGYESLVDAVALRSGVAADRVATVAGGTSMANHIAMAALVEPGDEVLMEQPVYEPILATARYLGARVGFFERRFGSGFGVDPDEIARVTTSRTRLVVLTNLHNPSSAMLGEETLLHVGDAARAAGARVLVDEVYLDAAFERATRSAALLGPEFVVTNSLTKVYGLSGLRCGWVLAEPDVVRRIGRLNDLFGVNGPHPAERIAVAAFRVLDELRERARALLDTNRRVLDAFYDSRKDLAAARFPWGTTSFPKLLGGSVERLCELLRTRYETSVVPGAFFDRPEHFRIGLTCDPAVFSAGLERLGAALDDLGAA